jgi:hypothetical protein
MMHAMKIEPIAVLAAVAVVACGGGKGADSPGTCPEGTVLKGADCVPSGDDVTASSGSSSKSADEDKSPSSAAASSQGDDTSSSGGKALYDKEAVEVQLKRAARQVKANCGSASDDEGNATGPWGATKATVTLGRNGHVRQVTVPAPYEGKPVGICVVHAFEKIQFPPYAGSNDVSVDWDIDIVKPKH